MTEITHVPLAPIASGSLRKLWLGVFIAVLGAAAVAIGAMPPMVQITTIKAGSGPRPVGDDYVLVEMVGKLDNGTVFQPKARGPLQMGRVIPGFTKALEQMQVGGQYQVRIPASLAYGAAANGPVPANANLNFTITLLDFKTAAELQQQQQMMERIGRGQAESPPGGAPHGVPDGPRGAAAGAGSAL